MKTQGSHETTNQKNAQGKIMTEGTKSHEEARKGPDSAAREDMRRKEMEKKNQELNPKDPKPTKPPNPEVNG